MMLQLVLLGLLAPMLVSGDKAVPVELKVNNDVAKTEEYMARGFNWIGDRFFGIVDSMVLDGRAGRAITIEGRKRKKVKLNKYVFPLIVGFLLIKSVLLPIALKSLAILSGKAVVLSLMSLILAAIVGLRSVAANVPAQNKVDLVNVPVTKYRRKDFLDNADALEEDPYRYYGDRRRKK